MSNAPRHLKAVPDPLWKRALRNRKHWDNYQIAANAFELARKLEIDRRIDDDIRVAALKARETAKQKQIKRDKPLRVNTPPIAPLPLPSAAPCPRCGGDMVFKPGIEKAMHVGRICTGVNHVNVVPFYRHRVTPVRCATIDCPRVGASKEGLCALCASRARRKVVDHQAPTDVAASKDPAAGGSVDGS